jgi:alanyl-tRNA synthetase
MSKQLEELGYTKKTCKTCGNDFWTIGERETCGDAPCDKYEFIGNPATGKKYDLTAIQNIFMKFFQKRGHTAIERYPVLAKRWRDDVFLVGASIYDFQPWVTSGMVEPPANPLVVAQPSIRLNDVDNVGRTGRHMTCFTMGGHHAFNSPDKYVYWEDETVNYCHDFIKQIGINPEEISFIESWWEGGGNAGPSYEVCVRGVELATLVFIKYKTFTGGKLKEIPLTIVDTGYGLERFAWITQGTPTAYEASFGPVIDELKDLAQVDVDQHILAENARVAGMMDIETFADLRTLRARVARRVGLSMEDLEKTAEPMEAIYIIADHSRCLGFMLADGVIPSNVKEGYLARLILRRTIRFMKDLGLRLSLADIMEIQLDFLSKSYPEIKVHGDHILKVIELEDKRYYNTIRKGKRLIQKSVKYLQKEDENEMPLEVLIKLYDSHGIPPETIKAISEKMNFQVNVPDNFYTMVATEHSEETEEERDGIELDFPETEVLFYQEPYNTVFEAHILGTYENNIILDSTLFYPEGGGQPSDIGFLEIKDQKIKVIHAERIGSTVLHKVDVEDIEQLHTYKGMIVKGEIDEKRRLDLTRNHTATHLLVTASREVLGDHVWQAGAQKGVKKSRIDLSHYKRISTEELQKIEQIANKHVMENLDVESQWMDRNDAEKKYGLILYQGGVVPGTKIRVVKIDDVDVQACAGTHVDKTGDIGLIRITRSERIQDGVERVEFSAGEAAIEAVQQNETLLRDSASIFKVKPEQLPKTCNRFFTEWKAFKNEIDRLKSQIAFFKIEGFTSKTEKIDDLMVLTEIIEADMGELIKIATYLTEKQGKVDVLVIGNNHGKIVGAASQKALDRGIKINEIIKEAAQILGGGGGGRLTFAQGAGPNGDKMQDALDFVLDYLEELI